MMNPTEIGAHILNCCLLLAIAMPRSAHVDRVNSPFRPDDRIYGLSPVLTIVYDIVVADGSPITFCITHL